MVAHPTSISRTLLLMRHAKSSWDNPAWTDHDRPLNERGETDAPRMANALAHHGLTPSLIVTSTAIRARTTALRVAQSLQYSGEVIEEPQLYLASPLEWHDVFKALPDQHETVLLVGHNPGLEQLLHRWSGESIEMPTASIAIIDATVTAWRDYDRFPLTVAKVLRPRDLD